jgi:hypothetical protein
MESEIDLNMNMKTSRIILIALAAMAAVACGPNVSDTTRVKVVFEGEAPDAVKLSLPVAAIDQTIPVEDGKFQVELLASKTGFASLRADNMRIEFISDGTPLTISISADKRVSFVSKYPELSLNHRHEIFKQAQADHRNRSEVRLDSIQNAGGDSEALNKFYEEYRTDTKSFLLKTIHDNNDNVICLRAIDRLALFVTDIQLDSVLNTLSPEIASLSSVSRLKKTLESRIQEADSAKVAQPAQ